MRAIRNVVAAAAGLVARLVRPFLPAPDSTEGAVYAGMVLLAVGFAIAGWIPAVFLVPGAILVLLGSLPAITAMRRGA